ncbi:MAG: hypothetical protein OXT64_10700 [Gammaproteobacteria bacterium]|nr:hypothetical protein [Gammaproteobacteria bacterium]
MKRKPKRIELLPESYSPTKEELEEDVSIDASPWDVARALVQPVKVVEKSVTKHRAELRRKRGKK